MTALAFTTLLDEFHIIVTSALHLVCFFVVFLERVFDEREFPGWCPPHANQPLSLGFPSDGLLLLAIGLGSCVRRVRWKTSVTLDAEDQARNTTSSYAALVTLSSKFALLNTSHTTMKTYQDSSYFFF